MALRHSCHSFKKREKINSLLTTRTRTSIFREKCKSSIAKLTAQQDYSIQRKEGLHTVGHLPVSNVGLRYAFDTFYSPTKKFVTLKAKGKFKPKRKKEKNFRK